MVILGEVRGELPPSTHAKDPAKGFLGEWGESCGG